MGDAFGVEVAADTSGRDITTKGALVHSCSFSVIPEEINIMFTYQ